MAKKSGNVTKEPRDYPAIPNETVIAGISEKRWKVIIEAVKRTYKTTKVIMEYHRQGAGAFVRVVGGPMIGQLGDVEEWAIKQGKKHVKG